MKAFSRYIRISIFVSAMAGLSPLMGQTKEMMIVAKEMWRAMGPVRGESGSVTFDRVTADGDFVVFETFRPASFLILYQKGADVRLAAYSFENRFFCREENGGRQGELLEALTLASRDESGNLKGVATHQPEVGPLLMTSWGQGRFFNYSCPRDAAGPGGRAYAGCLAVAMGQIVRYYGKFNSFEFSHDYPGGYYGTLTASLGNYRWPAMEDSPVTVSLDVSDLLSDLGVLMHLSYGASGTTGTTRSALEAFHELGYSDAVLLRKSKFSPESWQDLFYQNLSEYKPMMVTGGGHAFVCDGFNNDGLFHFNLGWDGYADGWYPMTMVMNLPVNEVFAELEPVSWPVGPDRIWQSGTGSNQAVYWSYERGQQPLTSRVYTDDRLVAETTDRMIRSTELPPGLHRVFVSAVYDSGESRWIGPEMVFVPGKLLVMQDPALYHLFQKELGRGLPETQLLEIFEGDLSRIENIEIVQPVASLGDLVFCSRLKRLVINGYSGISLDAESLAGLTQLRILEWRNGTVSHPESLGRVNFLTELRLIGTSVPTLGFLRNLGNLLTLEYSGNAVPDADVIGALPRLEELRLSNASIKDPSFLAGMYNLVSLDLSSNDIEETGFLAKLSNLRFANLSDNRISNLLLTERLQALERVNASGNRIEGITATAELRRLRHLDLSSNRMVTPGRLFIYTPALEDLNLSGNNLRDMGLQRCPNLRLINVSDNNLLTTEWFSLQPELKRIVLTRNRISDLSGMMMNDLYKNLEYIDLIGNPLSKQSFAEHIPLLVTFADTVRRPAGCQPLSPCYATPCSGTCAPGTDAILSWSAEDPGGNILYDVYTIQGDSLVPLSLGLDTARLELDRWPSRAFSWAVAARTPDTVFYSGIYRVVLSDLWNVPFREGFEAYPKGTSIAEQSGIWLTENERRGSEGKAVVSENGPKSGIHCLELDSGMTAILPAGHLRVPYFALRFSAKFTTGARGCFEVANMNGTCLRMEYDGTDSGKFYVNNRFHCFFRTEPGSWMDFDILGHARNNNFHVMADNQVLINDWWPVPEGFIRIGEVRFSTVGGSLLIDDVRVNAPAALGISETRADCSDGFVMGPNPFDDFFRISFSQGGRYEMRLRDSMGRLVFLHSVYASAGAVYTVSPVAISPGIYFFDSGIPGAQPVKLIKSQPGY